MNYFEPTGDEPRWRTIYRLVNQLPVEGVVTYAQLSTALGYDFRTDRSGLAEAVKVLEKEDHRTLANVRGKGYRIARASEHADLARQHHLRSRRQLAKAISRASSARRDELTSEEARRVDAMESTLRAHADMIRRVESRVASTEKTLRDVRRTQSEASAGMDERLGRLEEVLRRHGFAVDNADQREDAASA